MPSGSHGEAFLLKEGAKSPVWKKWGLEMIAFVV